MTIALFIASCEKRTIACFNYSPSKVSVDEKIVFDASCTQNAYMFIWDFGDGAQDTTIVDSKTITHKYISKGIYVVTLHVKRYDGVSFLKSKPIISKEIIVE